MKLPDFNISSTLLQIILGDKFEEANGGRNDCIGREAE
jgi:hypothetical protein